MSDSGRTLVVRAGELRDLPALLAIYNHYVSTTAVTFDVEPYTLERRRDEWFSHYETTGPHRLLVATEGDAVLGYATSSRFRPKAAYATTVETSVYCHPDGVGRGLGTALYRALFRALAGEDLRRAVAGVTLPNDASVRLHERMGFVPIGVFTEVGRKMGRYWDVVWMEKNLAG